MNTSPLHPPAPKQTNKGKQAAGGARRTGDGDNDGDGDDGVWLRPQRFFAPEKPTGLEGLFAKTNLVEESDLQSCMLVHVMLCYPRTSVQGHRATTEPTL